MRDEAKTKKQLISEIQELRRHATDMKNAELELKLLKESQEKFAKAFLENSTPMVISTLAEGRYVDVSEAFLRLMGLKREEVVGNTSTGIGFLTKEQRSIFINELNSKGRVDNFELQVIVKGGELKSGLFNSSRISLGGEDYLLSVITDITELKRAEEDSRKSRRLMSELIEHSGALICVKDCEGRYELINRKWEEVTGWRRRDVLGKTDEELFPGSVGRQFRLNDLEVMESQTMLEKEEILEDEQGMRFFISIKFPLHGDDKIVRGICGMITDITDRKRMEEKLRESEALYRTFINATSDMVFLKDEQLRNIVVNRSLAAFFGKPEEEIIGKGDFELMPEMAAEKCHQTDIEALMRTSIVTSEEMIGDQVYETNKFPVDLGGNRTGVGGVIRNITNRKRAEDALNKLEREKSAILDAMSEIVIYVDTDLKVVWSNSATNRQFNLPAGQIEGRCCYRALHGLNKPCRICPVVKTLETGEPYTVEDFSSLGKRWTMHSYPVRDQKQNLVGIVEIVTDNTDRKQAEEALRDSKEQYEFVVENLKEVVFRTDAEGHWTFLNSAWTEVTGFAVEESLGKVFLEYVYPEDRQLNLELFGPLIERKKDYCRHEIRYTNNDGGFRWIEVWARLTLDEKGNATGTAGTLTDITERKRTEKELLLNSQRMQVLLQLGQMTEKTLKEVTDFALEEAVRLTQSEIGYLAFLNEDETVLTMHSWSKAAMAECAIIEKPIHYPVTNTGLWGEAVRQRRPIITNDYSQPNPWKKGCPEGHVRVLRHMNVPIFDGDRIVIVVGVGNKEEKYGETEVQQLTLLMQGMWRLVERKRAEETLREANRLLDEIIAFLPDATFVIDVHGKVIAWNKAIEQMTGIPKAEMIGKGEYEYALPFYGERRPILIDLALSSDADFEKRKYDISQRSVDTIYGEVYVPETYGGKGAYLYASASRLRDAAGNIVGAIESIRDITEREKMEEALRESEEKYRTIIENMEEGYHEVDIKGNFTFFNDSTCKILGYSRDELLGMNNRQYTDENNTRKVYQIYNSVFRTGKPVKNFEWQIIRKEGARRDIEVSVSLIKDVEGHPTGFRGIVRDTTDRKQAEKEKRRLEERLQRSEKMEALGTLAGGVAHDLNNVLGIVIGYAELLLNEIADASAIKSRVVNIMKGGEKAAAIVQDLLTLARRGVPSRQVLNLNKIVVDCQQSPEFEKLSSFHPTIRIETDLEPGLLNISGSSVHLNKTLFNLLSNANEAMSSGGTLAIKTANQYLDKPIQGYEEVREGDYVVLSISDTGEGIPPADLKHIFEPFYTKKVMGKSGTGLGLAVVWGTVKDHNGYVNVQSEEGRGSTFTLYFPASREEISSEDVAVSISKYMGKGESILVVDDVEGQRDLATEMLRKLNYSVASVSSGEEAVAYLKEHHIDLMVLDMIMDPGMDGLDTYRSILKIHPKQKALIVSGFSETDRVSKAQSLGAGAYIRKPYVIEKLGMAVRKELDRI